MSVVPIAAATAISILVLLGPVIAGRRSFFLRDLGTTHIPAVRLFGQLGPANTNPSASFGQAYRGNPNLLVYYRRPIAWLSADGHLVAHWLLGFAGMIAFLRSRRSSHAAAVAGAVAFSFSGYVLSSLSFLNATTTIGWLPWLLFVAAQDWPWATSIVISGGVIAIFSLTGEPVLIVAGVTLAIAVAARRSKRHCMTILAGAAVAVVLTAPIRIEEWRIARDSARFGRGFTAERVSAQSLHPARLVEFVLPGFFGTPDHLLRGGWWGYKINGDARPYIFSISIPLLLLVAIAGYGIATRGRRGRGWWILFIGALVAPMIAAAPVGPGIVQAVPVLHFVRYPIKLMLFATLAFAVLAADSVDYWWREAGPAGRSRAAHLLVILAAGFLIAGLYLGTNPSAALSVITRFGWKPEWRVSPDVVLAPIISRSAFDLCGHAVLFLFAAGAVRYRQRALAAVALMLLSVRAASELPRLAPTVAHAEMAVATPLVQAARLLPGPVCELARKDIDPVPEGLRGRYPSDDASCLAIAQQRQGWALAGAPLGVRYAYNNDPDGSYTLRNDLVQEALERHHSWTYQLKWLRAAGVSGIIAPSLGPPRPGIREIAREETIGIPARLFQITDTLPAVRRVGRVVWARTADEAVERFSAAGFDERTMLVVEAPPRTLAAASGSARITSQKSDELTIDTDGSREHVLFVAQTFTSTARATVNGKSAPLYPANVHLIGIFVPGGHSTVVLTF